MASKGKRPTLFDVAARVGMSKSAVSMALNHPTETRLSAQTVARIQRAATELNYRPNLAARAMRAGSTRTIGFISNQVTDTRFASAMIRGALEAAKAHDQAVLIAETSTHPKQLEIALHSMLDRHVDGIILGALTARQLDLPTLPDGVRAVAANCTSPAVDTAVLPAEREAGRRIAQLLLDAGHADGIAIVGQAPIARTDPYVSVTVEHRFAGIEETLGAAGVIPVAVSEFEAWETWNGYNATKELLSRGAPITAMICLNDRVAFGAYQAMHERGLSVPRDISVASFDDDDEIAPRLHPGLTSALLPYEEMGRRAMELVLDPERETGEHHVAMPVTVRDSITAPRHLVKPSNRRDQLRKTATKAPTP